MVYCSIKIPSAHKKCIFPLLLKNECILVGYSIIVCIISIPRPVLECTEIHGCQLVFSFYNGRSPIGSICKQLVARRIATAKRGTILIVKYQKSNYVNSIFKDCFFLVQSWRKYSHQLAYNGYYSRG
jgi:hypothetical protein